MGKLQNNQKGFGAIEFLLVVLALILVGSVGYYVSTANKDDKKTDTSVSSSHEDNNVTKEQSDNSDFKLYTSNELKLSFKYPKGWFVNEKKTSTGTRIYVSNNNDNFDYIASKLEADGQLTNAPDAPSAQRIPLNYQIFWVSDRQEDVPVERENAVKTGTKFPGNGFTPTVSTIKAGNVNINSYEYTTNFATVLEAYWMIGSKRYAANTDTMLALQTDTNQVLKNLLPTIKKQ
jgi:hypothetical protein